MSGRGGGIRLSEMESRHLEHLMTAPLVVRCKLCRWWAEGEAGEMIKRQKRHRERRHKIMESHPSRRGVRHLNTFRAPFISEADKDEIEAEVARRRRLHGLDEAA